MRRILTTGLAIFLTGLVIKLMDDFLDQEIDRLNNRYSLAIELERGILPYSLIIFSLAILCDLEVSISLFWASYIVGMGTNKDKLPTGLKAYQELLIVLLSGFLFFKLQQFLFSLLIILFIQTADDYIDYYREDYIDRENFINYLGQMGTFFLAVFSLVASLNINWKLTLIIIASSILIDFLLKGKKR